MKNTLLVILFGFIITPLIADTYSIENLFSVTIPEEIEILSIDQEIRTKKDNTQYYLSTSFGILYKNVYLYLSINCYGNSNPDLYKSQNNVKTNYYYNLYNLSSQLDYLFANYEKTHFVNTNNVKYSIFVSDWDSGWSSDYYGVYFKLNDSTFSECIISINNSWSAFEPKNQLSINDNKFRDKYLAEKGDIKTFYQLLDSLVNSITFNPSDKQIIISNGFSYQKYKSDYSYCIPTINNLRMRSLPSLQGEVLGVMQESVYTILGIGIEDTIDGIKGNWILVIPTLGNKATWVFNGYTRKPSEAEISKYVNPEI
jgi:hypothetical protein